MNKFVITCKTITKMSENVQKQKLRFFAKTDEKIRLEIISIQRETFHKIKNNQNYKEVSNQLITLASLILAIEQCLKKMNVVKINSIKQLSNRKKAKSKMEKLLQYWSIVLQLKDKEDFSFRAISDYLFKYHKFDVSHSTINKYWNEIEVEKKDKK